MEHWNDWRQAVRDVCQSVAVVGKQPNTREANRTSSNAKISDGEFQHSTCKGRSGAHKTSPADRRLVSVRGVSLSINWFFVSCTLNEN